MAVATREPSKKGPVSNKEGVPYDYIIIVDLGSKGLRAYIYNWLSSQYLVDQGVDVVRPAPRLVKKLASVEPDPDLDLDLDLDLEEDLAPNKPPGSVKHDDVLPTIQTRPEWKKKIKPGISSFSNHPGSVGEKHIKKLLKAASKIIPKEQQYRTPFFLHATAGMRLLKPSEQQQILDQTCRYVQEHLNFYVPDCGLHVTVIDGDLEGLYGWIGLNYLMGLFDRPHMHDHGKNHHTYGLLDMGGASTQIAFQPNSTEAEEHKGLLYTLKLASFGQLSADLSYEVFLTLFLGYGMYQARDKYLKVLVSQALNSTGKLYDKKLALNDPCSPNGLTKTESVEGANQNHEFTMKGTGNFTECLNTLYPLLAGSLDKLACDLDNPQDTLTCLLSDLIPSLDFDVDRFVGVSGYWDAIGNLLNLQDDHKSDASPQEKYLNAYKYASFYKKAEDICAISWDSLKALNDKPEPSEEKYKLADLSDDELSELCYKSSWVLNVLHRGLGFPRYGVDDAELPKNGSSIHVAEKINGLDFSWTLGRAVLYLSAESAAAYAKKDGATAEKIGFVHGVASDTFYYGGEIVGVEARPVYKKGAYKTHRPNKSDDSHWDKLEKHRVGGSLVFLALLLVIAYLLMGRKRRLGIVQPVQRLFERFTRGRGKYARLGSGAVAVAGEEDIELGEVSSDSTGKDSSDADERFRIGDE